MLYTDLIHTYKVLGEALDIYAASPLHVSIGAFRRLSSARNILASAITEQFFDAGRAGANADTKHPRRAEWEALRAAINNG